MDFEKKLALAHSKLFTDQIAEEIHAHPERIDKLIQIFENGTLQMKQRSAWVVSVIAEKDPNLLTKYLKIFTDLLEKPNKHDAINRGICRSLQFMDIPEKYEGRLLDLLFKLMNSNQEPIAVKVFAMQVIYNISKKYPDIIPELKASIEAQLPNGSPGIKSKGRKILKQIEKV